jgi:hypothetical protein
MMKARMSGMRKCEERKRAQRRMRTKKMTRKKEGRSTTERRVPSVAAGVMVCLL